MLKLLAQRLLGAIPVMLVLVLVVFVLREIAPVDQVVSLVGEKAPPEVYERVREELGLNDPLPTQYVNYLGDLAHGDLGQSSVTRRPIAEDLDLFLRATLELVLVHVLAHRRHGRVPGHGHGPGLAGGRCAAARDDLRGLGARVPRRARRPHALLPAARLAAGHRPHRDIRRSRPARPAS